MFFQQRKQILIFIFQLVPLLNEGRHEQLDVLWFVQMVPNTICQGANRIVEDEQILVLILVEGKHQCFKDKPKVRNQLCASLFF